MEANGRFEGMMWISTAVGPSLGGALIGVLGPVITVVADAGSYLLSAIRIRAIATPEPAPPVLVGLPLVGPGLAGIVVVTAVELGMISCMGVFNPSSPLTVNTTPKTAKWPESSPPGPSRRAPRPPWPPPYGASWQV